MKRLITVLFLLSAIFVNAQPAIVTGKVFDKKTKETLPGASVFILGTSWGASTDLDGQFKITNVHKGIYDIVISYVGYQPDTIKKFQISTNTPSLELYLNESSLNLNEVSILAQRVVHTEASVIQDIKKSEQVVNGVSNEQITKNQDKNTAEVVKRIPGITIADNRFVIIRGLSDRYNATLLNEGSAPSFENDKKSFAFDMLPSSVVERIMVYKTGSAELPGDFSGGAIQVFTKKYVDSNFTNISYGTRYNQYTSFNNFKTDRHGTTEFLGFSNGDRNLPNNFPENLNTQTNNQIFEASKKLNNNWALQSKNALPDQSINLTIGRKFHLFKKQGISLSSVGYSTSKQSYIAQMYNYNSYDLQKMHSDTIYHYTDQVYQEKNNVIALQNFVLNLSSKNIIEFKNLLSQSNSNHTVYREGINFEEGSLVRNYSFNYQERSLYNSQLQGEHTLKNDLSTITWNAFYSYTLNNQPDYRRIRTTKSIDSDANQNYQVIIAPSASTLDAGRFFAKLNENNWGGNINYKLTFVNSSNTEIFKIKSGIGVESKKRTFKARWMSYKKASSSNFDNSLLNESIDQLFTEQNMNNTGFLLTEGTNPSDQYTAQNNQLFAYASISFKPIKNIQIIAGIRNEYNIQSLYSRNYSNKAVVVENPILSILPSLNTTYSFNEKNLLRFAYFKSVNRPEFRELAPFSYYDFSMNNVLIGNENLKNADIHNIDLRWEFYPEASEMINIGLFYKKFNNAIEMYYVPGSGSGGTRNFTYRNAPSASNYGIETEIRKSLSSLLPQNKIFEKTGILLNAAHIYSIVNLGNEAKGQLNKRPLMGQSPYILNAGFYYQNSYTGLQANLVYNIIGKRIYVVGSYGTPNIYELPKNNLDLTISFKLLSNFKFTLNINNLLNSTSHFMQDSNEDGKINKKDETISQYKNGINVNLGLTFNL
ncbi:MAG TPA: TonB-dependent receptor [Bacteroidales bacterium]|nr:TonB-dependent receptor [Bacteroidales bacterium]